MMWFLLPYLAITDHKLTVPC